MLTYQVRKRVLRVTEGSKLEFPADVVISFHLQPLQPFGSAPSGGLTTVQSQPASVLFNANTGQHHVECKKPLTPLEVRIEELSRNVVCQGNRVTVNQTCADFRSLTELLESLFFGLPLLLNVEFADPPLVERVDGRIGSVPFRWELADWQVHLDITTQARQEERFVVAWNRFGIISAVHRRRLVAALHYFHVACRLKREAKSPGEFLAEALLNFNKVLEVLFGPTRDEVRASLSQLGYAPEEIERDFIPVMLIRNSMDVGHPLLALFKMGQLEILHKYADRAETTFRDFFQRVFQAIDSGRLDIPDYEIAGINAETQRMIENLGERLNKLEEGS